MPDNNDIEYLIDDGGYSKGRLNSKYTGSTARDSIRQSMSWNSISTDNEFSGLAHANNIYTRNEIYNSSTNPLFNKTWRFGLLNPYGAIASSREFLLYRNWNHIRL